MNLKSKDVHVTIATALGRILAQPQLAKWHERAKNLAAEPGKSSLLALVTIMARLQRPWISAAKEAMPQLGSHGHTTWAAAELTGCWCQGPGSVRPKASQRLWALN